MSLLTEIGGYEKAVYHNRGLERIKVAYPLLEEPLIIVCHLYEGDTESQSFQTLIRNKKVYVQVRDLRGAVLLWNPPPPKIVAPVLPWILWPLLDFGKTLRCLISRFSPPPLSSLFLLPHCLPLLPHLRPSLLGDVEVWRCAPPTHASTWVPKPPFFFFPSRPNGNEWTGGGRSVFFFSSLVKLHSTIRVFKSCWPPDPGRQCGKEASAC